MNPEQETATPGADESTQSNAATTTSAGASTNYNRTRDTRRNVARIESEDRNFEGKTKDIGAVLGLKTERLTHKVPFDTFREKLAEYVLKELTNARHVIPLVEDMVHPMKQFMVENKPKVKRKRSTQDDASIKKVKSEIGSLSTVAKDIDDDNDDEEGDTDYYDPDDFVEKMLLETKIKAYVAQEEHLKNNINKIYAIVWGQCSSSLQAVIKGHDDFEMRHKRRDVVWLFEQVKVVTAGIDNKSNK